VSLHPKFPLMAFGCETNVVKTYDVQKYAYCRVLPMQGEVHSVRFSPCGNFLATAASSREHDIFRVVIWKLTHEEGKWKLEKYADDNITYDNLQESPDDAPMQLNQFFLHQGRIGTLEFLPRAGNQPCKLLASGSRDQTVRIWAFKDGQDLSNPGWTEVWRRHTGEVTCVRATIDGAFLASSSSDDRKICIWRLAEGAASGEAEGRDGKGPHFGAANGAKKKKGKGGKSRRGKKGDEGQKWLPKKKSYDQIIEFLARSPVYTLSFFPIIERWKNEDVKRYLLACGTEDSLFLLKVVSAQLRRSTSAVSFPMEFDLITKGEKASPVMMDTALKGEMVRRKNKLNPIAGIGKREGPSLQVELDFTEDLSASLLDENQPQEEQSVRLVSLDTAIYEADCNGKKRQFYLCLGGGLSGKLMAWVFTSVLDYNLKLREEFTTYSTLKRMIVNKKFDTDVEAIKAKAYERAKETREIDRKKASYEKRMRRLNKEHVTVGEHMTGKAIYGVALPQWYSGSDSKQWRLLNKLREQYRMLGNNQYFAISVGEDETSRVFKFSIKEPRQIKIDEDFVMNEEEKRGLLGALNKVKGGVQNVAKLLKLDKAEKKEDDPAFCVASGEVSRTTKRMDGTLILQRSLTENQANILYTLKEQTREMRKEKIKKEQEAKKQEFKFRLDVEAEHEKRDDIKADKFDHYQNLAEPSISKKKNSASRESCQGDCVAM